MDAPILVALIVFIGIFLMFFIISLLADLLIVAIAIGSAVAAYFIPEIYPADYFQQLLNDITLFKRLGLAFPPVLDTATHYLLGFMIIFGGTLACVPILPFSAVYRQMLGANRLSGGEKDEVRHMVRDELEVIRQGMKERVREHNTPLSEEEEAKVIEEAEPGQTKREALKDKLQGVLSKLPHKSKT